MQYRQLGRSGLKVSVVTIGAMAFGAQGGFTKIGDTGVDEARRQIDLCIDAGVNLIDTSDIYSAGGSEAVIGEVLGGQRKGGLLIATKCRFGTSADPNGRGLTRHHIIAACEASLKRLRTDVIDLYQAHAWDGVTPLEETMEAFDSLIRAGKVRYIGCSNFSGWHLMKSLGVSDRDHRQRYVSQQIHYSLEAREVEYELIPIAIDQGVGVLVWSPLMGGLLTGKHRRDRSAPAGSRQSAGWTTTPPLRDAERLWDIVDELVAIAEARGASPSQVALAWLIAQPGVTSVIVGGRNEAQFKDNLGCVDVVLTDEELKRLHTVSVPTLLYPYWHQTQMPKELSPADLSLLGDHI